MTALARLKVIDLTHMMAGPTCTLMLAVHDDEAVEDQAVSYTTARD